VDVTGDTVQMDGTRFLPTGPRTFRTGA
jgi:hypothetical protein